MIFLISAKDHKSFLSQDKTKQDIRLSCNFYYYSSNIYKYLVLGLQIFSFNISTNI